MEAQSPSTVATDKDAPGPVVSVIVPAHNAAGRLPALFDALRAQTADPSLFEVIVVDDMSTDATPAVVEQSGIARLIRAPAKRGSYSARNLAIRVARGGVLAFTDSDCTPDATWVERGLEAIKSAALVAGHVEIPLGERPTAAAMLDVARGHIDQERRVANEGFGATANLWVRREVIARVGEFRDDLASGGDYDFSRRATAAGATLAYAADVGATHPPRSEARDLFRKQFRLGFGAAQRRRLAGPGEDRPRRIWADPRHYVPRRTIYGADVLERRGYRLTLREHIWLRVVQYFCCQLPLALGNLTGTLARRG